MRNLLHVSDRDRLVAHLRGALLREVTVGGRRLMALAETDGGDGASFCAVPANAAAAELLAQPAIRDADPGFADGVLDFAMAMADAPLPCRRAALGGTEILRDDPRDFEILTPFHRYTGDLSAGIIRQQLRGAGSALPPVVHSGNLVEFRIGRHRNGVDAEDGITSFALRRVGDAVLLVHESRIIGKAGLLWGRPVEAGTLCYSYEIAAGSPLLRLTVGFTASRHRLRRLRLTTAVDQIGAERLELAAGRLATEPGGTVTWQDMAVPEQAGMRVWADQVPVPHLAVAQADWPEAGPVLHIRPGNPSLVLGVKAQAARRGTLHWLILRHGPFDLKPGGQAELTEHRLLGLGMPAEAGAAMMAAAGAAGPGIAGLDLDPMAPNGATLNAVATTLMLAAQGAYHVPLPAARVAALGTWLDRRMAAFPVAGARVTDLAHAVLAAEARLRTGAEAAPFEALLGALLARQRPDGGFLAPAERPGGLAAHAVALLALARAVPHAEPGSLGGPILQALSVVRPGLAPMLDLGLPIQVEALVLRDAPPAPLSGYAEATGLMARAAGAVLLAAEARPDAIPAEAIDQARALHGQAIGLLRPLVRPRAGALEVTPSPLGGQANPAGQVAALLGLLAPDAAILRQVPISA